MSERVGLEHLHVFGRRDLHLLPSRRGHVSLGPRALALDWMITSGRRYVGMSWRLTDQRMVGSGPDIDTGRCGEVFQEAGTVELSHRGVRVAMHLSTIPDMKMLVSPISRTG